MKHTKSEAVQACESITEQVDLGKLLPGYPCPFTIRRVEGGGQRRAAGGPQEKSQDVLSQEVPKQQQVLQKTLSISIQLNIKFHLPLRVEKHFEDDAVLLRKWLPESPK